MVAEHEHVRVANVTLVRRFIEAINDSWNVDVMRELASDDFLHDPVRAGVVPGTL